jgi:hypothetical protein
MHRDEDDDDVDYDTNGKGRETFLQPIILTM